MMAKETFYLHGQREESIVEKALVVFPRFGFGYYRM